ncbi:hypothetical protein ACFV6Y_38700 [Streptomyces massasporeus]|uniref:hypothetical protein n=1 Tax=Streptomyces massasporeus TaxID=67324 RepID=UPI003656EBC3
MTIRMHALTSNGLARSRNGERYLRPEAFTFPGGEHHLRNIPEFDEPVTWIADVRGADPNDLIKAALLADVAHSRDDGFVLLLPYLPAARADRGAPLGLRVYANLINTMTADRVVVIDPHSPAAARHLPGIHVTDHTELVERAVRLWDHDRPELALDAVIAPDKGARDRAASVAARLGIDLYQADKRRDFETGRILGIEMTEGLPKSGRYLVVDDICDGGGTFAGLAEAIGVPREQLSLWVTHGIFSGQANYLRDYYSRIITTDSHPGHNRVDVATTIIPTFVHMLAAVPAPKGQS